MRSAPRDLRTAAALGLIAPTIGVVHFDEQDRSWQGDIHGLSPFGESRGALIYHDRQQSDLITMRNVQ